MPKTLCISFLFSILLHLPSAQAQDDTNMDVIDFDAPVLVDSSRVEFGLGKEPAFAVEDQRTYLVPELKGAGFTVHGTPQFHRRVSFSPAMGQLGNQELFSFRVAYNPNSWIGYEVSFGHNPASSVHAMIHTFNVLLRYPIPWRAQPYGTIGYGMMKVYPGQALNADPVTKNTLLTGGGLEFYLRDDVAIRGELRGVTVFGQELGSESTTAYSYREYTIGFAFYRSLGG